MGCIIPNMGYKNNGAPASIASALFSSTQRRVLALFFGQPERRFFSTELIALAAGGSGAVQRELKRLHECGLVTMSRIGNRKFYQANPESPIFSELRNIVEKLPEFVEPAEERWNMTDAHAIGEDDNDSVDYEELFAALEAISAR